MIYKEIVGRIQENDFSVPVQKGLFSYYSRTIKDAQYPVYQRKKDDVEQVLLDQNSMDLEYMDLGKIQVSPNHKILCYSIDTDGSEFFTIYFKDLESGELLSDQIHKTCGDFEWTQDSKAIYYTTLDHIHRSDKVFRHVLLYIICFYFKGIVRRIWLFFMKKMNNILLGLINQLQENISL